MTNIGRFIGYIFILQITIISQSVANETMKRHTWIELRDKDVVKQQEDMSCGAAALTTLLSHYYGENTTEKEILGILKIRTDKASKAERARKKKNGFSLFDLKFAAQLKGYDAAGFRLTLDQLRQLKAPVIVYVEPFGYHHFAVLRGIAGDRVFLADPSRGNMTLTTAQFADEYGGVIFALAREGEEDILKYPLALSRSDDYVRPDLHRIMSGINSYRDYATNLTLRARLR